LKPLSSLNDQSEIIDVDIPSTEPISNNDNDPIPSVFTSPIKDEPLSSTDNPSSELFYDFQAENFHAEQVIHFLLNLIFLKSRSIQGRSICLYHM